MVWLVKFEIIFKEILEIIFSRFLRGSGYLANETNQKHIMVHSNCRIAASLVCYVMPAERGNLVCYYLEFLYMLSSRFFEYYAYAKNIEHSHMKRSITSKKKTQKYMQIRNIETTICNEE